MGGDRLMLCGLTFALTVLHAAAAPPDQSKPPGRVPPKATTTPTPMITVTHMPFSLQPCTAVGTVAFDAAYNAKFPGVVRYVGPMTFTANVDMRAVLMYTMNYDGHGGFLGACTCPEFPKGGDNPATAPPNSNFKRLESRTYQLSLIFDSSISEVRSVQLVACHSFDFGTTFPAPPVRWEARVVAMPGRGA